MPPTWSVPPRRPRSRSTTGRRPRRAGPAEQIPTPTPASVPVVPKGHVHWAWVPGFSVALFAVAALGYSFAR